MILKITSALVALAGVYLLLDISSVFDPLSYLDGVIAILAGGFGMIVRQRPPSQPRS